MHVINTMDRWNQEVWSQLTVLTALSWKVNNNFNNVIIVYWDQKSAKMSNATVAVYDNSIPISLYLHAVQSSYIAISNLLVFGAIMKYKQMNAKKVFFKFKN
jgi:hypothetical protein